MSVSFHDLLLAPPELYPAPVIEGTADCTSVAGFRRVDRDPLVPAFVPGVLEINASKRSASFFDLEPYEQRRRYRNGLTDILDLAHFTAAVLLVIAISGIGNMAFLGDGDSGAALAGAGLMLPIAVAVAILFLPFLIPAWLNRRRAEEIPAAAAVEVPAQLLEILDGGWVQDRHCESEPPPEVGLKQRVIDAAKEGAVDGAAETVFGDLGSFALEAQRMAASEERLMRIYRKALRMRRRQALKVLHFHKLVTNREPVRVALSEWVPGAEFTDRRFFPARGAGRDPPELPTEPPGRMPVG